MARRYLAWMLALTLGWALGAKDIEPQLTVLVGATAFLLWERSGRRGGAA